LNKLIRTLNKSRAEEVCKNKIGKACLQGKMHPCWLSLVIAVGAGLARAAGPPAQWMGPPGRVAGHPCPPGARAFRPPAACADPLGIPGASCTDGECVGRLRGGGRKQEDDGSDDSDGVIGSKVGKSPKKKPTPVKAAKKAESEESQEVREAGDGAIKALDRPRMGQACCARGIHARSSAEAAKRHGPSSACAAYGML
jgi:hypothetical protein